MKGEKWLLWCHREQAWYGPELLGFTKERAEAGRFSFEEARQFCGYTNGSKFPHDQAYATMCPDWEAK